MNKTTMVRAFAEKTGRTITETKTFIDELEEFIVELVKTEDEVALGIGKFIATDKPEHEARNPKTGETITVSAKRVVKFKGGKALKDVK